jgi:hypothetical protein
VRGRKPGKTWETSEEIGADEAREIERDAIEQTHEEMPDIESMPAEAEAYFEDDG